MFELKGRYAFPDVNRDVVRNVSRAVCVRYLRTIGPLTIIKGLVRDVTYFSALSNNWFSSLASQARNSGSSPDGAIFAAMLKLVARPACHAGVLWACEFKSRWLR